MKNLLFLSCIFFTCFCFSQESATFYIVDGNDDVNEDLSEVPVFSNEYLVLGRTGGGSPLRIGLRYQNVTIPEGAEILSAHIQFTSFSASETDTITMLIRGESSANAAPFAHEESEIYHRESTHKTVKWTTQNWQAFIPGPDQKTIDLKEIIQEIVDLDGWASGNAMHIKMYKFSFGPDSLFACSFEYMGDWYAPQLQVEYIDPNDITELPGIPKLSIYPNPASEEINIRFTNDENRHFNISLKDIIGREVLQIHDGLLEKGPKEFHVPVSESGLQAGMYVVTMIANDVTITRKLVIK